MAKKMTKKEMFAKIAEAMSADTEVVEFCAKEIAALDKKAAKARERAAQKRAEGDELKDVVKSVLTEDFQTTADIMLQIEGDEVTVGKVSYRLNALVKDGVAQKEDVTVETSEGKKVKRKAYALV